MCKSCKRFASSSSMTTTSSVQLWNLHFSCFVINDRLPTYTWIALIWWQTWLDPSSLAVPDASTSHIESRTDQNGSPQTNNRTPNTARRKKNIVRGKTIVDTTLHKSELDDKYTRNETIFSHFFTNVVVVAHAVSYADCGTHWQSNGSTNHTNAIPSSTVTHDNGKKNTFETEIEQRDTKKNEQSSTVTNIHAHQSRSCLFLQNLRESRIKVAIMAMDKPRQRGALRDKHRIAMTESNEHPELKPLQRTCQRLAQLNAVTSTFWRPWSIANLVEHLHALSRWIFHYACTNKSSVGQILSFNVQHVCGCLGHVRDHCDLTEKLQYERTHRQKHTSNHVLTRTENLQSNVVTTTSWRLKTKTNLMTHILTLQRVRCPIHMRNNAGRFPSCRIDANRETWSHSLRLDQSLLCGPKVVNDTESINILTGTENHNIQIKIRLARHQRILHIKLCDDHIVTTLVESRSGGIHPRAPTQKYQRFPHKKKKQRLSFDIQQIRGSLGHVRDHSEAQQNQSNAVPHSNVTGVESRTHKNGKPHASETKLARRCLKIFSKTSCGETHRGQKPT